MSAEPDNELSLDLQFLPDWAQEDTGVNKYANHKGEEDRPRGRKGAGRKGSWDDRRPPRGDRKPASDRRPQSSQAQRGGGGNNNPAPATNDAARKLKKPPPKRKPPKL